MGQLLRRTPEGDQVLAEWTPSDPESVKAAQSEYRLWPAQEHEAVQSDGVHYEPLTGDELPVDAEQVIVSTAMGGG